VVDYSFEDSVAEIVLNDPGKLNALNETAIAELGAAYERAEADGARAVILRG